MTKDNYIEVDYHYCIERVKQRWKHKFIKENLFLYYAREKSCIYWKILENPFINDNEISLYRQYVS